MCPMEYKYVKPEPKPSKRHEEMKAYADANDAGWVTAMLNRGFFPTAADAMMFLDSHKDVRHKK